MKKLNISRPGFFDKDIACLFSDMECTSLTCVQCAVFLQTISRLIQKSGKKSIVTTAPDLQREWFPFWSTEVTKRLLQKLRQIGVIKTQMVYKRAGKAPQRFTRIWIQDKKIIELAKQVQGEVELSAMAKRVQNDHH